MLYEDSDNVELQTVWGCNTGAGNLTWIPWECSQYSELLNHLSSPWYFTFNKVLCIDNNLIYYDYNDDFIILSVCFVLRIESNNVLFRAISVMFALEFGVSRC